MKHADHSPGHAKQKDCLWGMVEVMGRSKDVAASVEVEEADEMVRWTALSAAATSTRDELKQCGGLPAALLQQ